MNRHEVILPSGTLNLVVERTDIPLDELCGFAVRQNPKRGFLFVSKVLGKHWPVRPADSTRIHALLSNKIGAVEGGVWAVAMAETATGLGEMVMQEWKNTFGGEVFFQITTRYPIPDVDSKMFEEAHSHAASQFIHHPAHNTHQTLVIIDDEMTTGNTMKNLTEQLLTCGAVKRVVWVSLTSWLGRERRETLQRWAVSHDVSLDIVSILDGEYCFTPNPAFSVALPDNVEPANTPRVSDLPLDYLRQGVLLSQEPCRRQKHHPNPRKILVVGSGELNGRALRLARRIESLLGHTAYVQSVTRSPIRIGESITNAVSMPDPYYQNVPHYLYNHRKHHYDEVVLLTEAHDYPSPHSLFESHST